MNIQQAFDIAAADYDQLRRLLIPCFDDFYETAVRVVPFEKTAPLSILDLGAGTGLYSGMICAVFPIVSIHLTPLKKELCKHFCEKN